MLALHLDHILADLKDQDPALDELIIQFESTKEEDEAEIKEEPPQA